MPLTPTHNSKNADELQLFEAIVTNIQTAVVVLDREFSFIYANPAAQAFQDINHDGALSDITPYTIFYPDLLTSCPLSQLPIFNKPSAATAQAYLKHPDGPVIPLKISGKPLPGKPGGSLGWLLMLEPAHEPTPKPLAGPPHRGDDHQPRVDKLLKHILDMLPTPIFIKDAESRILIVNQACEALWGYSAQDLLGTDCSQFFPPEQIQEFLSKDCEVWNNRAPVINEEWVWSDKFKQNRRCITVKKPIYDQQGTPLYLIATTEDITERQQTEQSLRETLARLHAVYDSLPFLAWMKDKEGHYLYANKHWLQSAGVTDASTINQLTDFALWPPALAEHYRATDQQVMKSRHSITLTEKALDAGRQSWTETIKSPVIDDQGQVIGTTGLARDITETRNTEEQRRNYSERLRLASKAAAIGICEWHPETGQAEWDARNYEIFGIAQGTPIDYPSWEKLVVPEDLPSASSKLRKLMRDKQEVHCEFRIHRQNDGQLRYIQAAAIATSNDSGQLDKIIGVNLDITDLKQTELALRESQMHLAQAQAQAHLGSWTLDIPHNILKWSDENHRIFAVEPGTALTYEYFLERVHPDDKSFVDQAWQAALQGNRYDIQHRIIVDGAIKWLRERADLEFAADGSLLRAVGTSQDITELKDIEKTLESSRLQLRHLAARREKAREEERKRIAREVHDELGQMLTALRMEVSLLRMQFAGDTPLLSEKIHDIMGLLDQTIQVTRNVATSLRPSAIEMGIVPALEWLTRKFAEQSGIECELFYPDEYFEMDEDCSIVFFRITQESLTNVLRHAEADQVKISLSMADEHYCLEIEDNGRGFDTSKPRKSKSFGLLGIQERSLMLSGATTITSTPDQGTLIQVRIPTHPSRQTL